MLITRSSGCRSRSQACDLGRRGGDDEQRVRGADLGLALGPERVAELAAPARTSEESASGENSETLQAPAGAGSR